MDSKTLVDSGLTVVECFSMVVPGDHNPETHLGLFRKHYSQEFLAYDYRLNDKNFRGVTSKLVAGQRLRVDINRVNEMMPYSNCLALLENQKTLLTGAQGLSLAWVQGRKKFPRGRILSLDKETALYRDSKNRVRIPSIRRGKDGTFEWFLSIADLFKLLEGFHFVLSFHEE